MSHIRYTISRSGTYYYNRRVPSHAVSADGTHIRQALSSCPVEVEAYATLLSNALEVSWASHKTTTPINILQKLLRPNPTEKKHLFHRSEPTFCTIAQAAQYYCKRYWKANVADVAHNRVGEPETGEVISNRAVSHDNNDDTNP